MVTNMSKIPDNEELGAWALTGFVVCVIATILWLVSR